MEVEDMDKSSESVFDSLKIYFDDVVWKELSVYEKKRLASLKRNYESLVNIGVNPAVPRFMLQKTRKKNTSCKETDPIKSEMKRYRHDSGIKESSSTLRKFDYPHILPQQSKMTFIKQSLCKNMSSSCVPCSRNEYKLLKASEFRNHVRRGISEEIDASDKATVEMRDDIDFVAEDNIVPNDQKRQINNTDTKEIRKYRTCPQYDYKIPIIINLRNDINKRHEGTRLHMCQKCDYRASRPRNLRRHVKAMHERIKAHSCHLCDYRASQSSDLQKHVDAVHEGKRPHKCLHCDYRTSNVSNIRRHVKVVHKRIKPYRCQICEFKAGEASDLRNHINEVHERKRPHKCPHCDYRAPRVTHLQRHVRVVHKIMKPCSCQICGYRASEARDLRKHMNAVHHGKKDAEISKT